MAVSQNQVEREIVLNTEGYEQEGNAEGWLSLDADHGGVETGRRETTLARRIACQLFRTAGDKRRENVFHRLQQIQQQRGILTFKTQGDSQQNLSIFKLCSLEFEDSTQALQGQM